LGLLAPAVVCAGRKPLLSALTSLVLESGEQPKGRLRIAQAIANGIPERVAFTTAGNALEKNFWAKILLAKFLGALFIRAMVCWAKLFFTTILRKTGYASPVVA
jgi:hypothetical protein